jgi:superfamily II DNA or RNA helicase
METEIGRTSSTAAEAAAVGPSGSVSPSEPDLGKDGVLTFEVFNTCTSIHSPHPYALDLIDRETRYPTQVALAMASGFQPPDVNACSECDGTGQDANGYGCPRCSGTGHVAGWDGWVRLLHRTKTKPPYFPTGLLYRATGILQHVQFPFRVVDRRQRPEEGCPEFLDLHLRSYQQEAVTRALHEGRGVLDMPPRSGKTRTMTEIVRRLSLPTVWIAPTDRIVQQTQDLMDEVFGKNYCTHQIGTKDWKEASRCPVVVCTAATAAGLPPDFYSTRQVLIIDEYHHAAAKSYAAIAKMCDHVYFRFGMTGTFFRSGHDLMALHSILSNTIFQISSSELLRLGHLVQTRVVYLPVLSERLRGIPREATYQMGVGKLGIQEHEYRQQLAANAASYLDKLGRRVLVLVATKRQGRDLASRVLSQIAPPPQGCQFRSVEFVSTDTERSVLGKILDSFTSRQEVRVLIGTSLLGEGVDLPVADALVYARGEKAEVSLTQNAYRVCTAAEGKKDAIIVDFADRHHKKLLEHAQERLSVFHAEPIFSVEVLKDPADFTFWAQK